eukprot:3288735-Prymnesium_polylepis.1
MAAKRLCCPAGNDTVFSFFGGGAASVDVAGAVSWMGWVRWTGGCSAVDSLPAALEVGPRDAVVTFVHSTLYTSSGMSSSSFHCFRRLST